jgi:hypothetical protein
VSVVDVMLVTVDLSDFVGDPVVCGISLLIMRYLRGDLVTLLLWLLFVLLRLFVLLCYSFVICYPVLCVVDCYCDVILLLLQFE